MIEPTQGRVVWYRPAGEEPGMTIFAGGQPMAATVAFVWNPRLVNLVVTDHAGLQHARTSVRLLQDGDVVQTNERTERTCEWMPYQKGQAARTEATAVSWKVKTPRPSIEEIEALIQEHGSINVQIAPNGDVMVRGAAA